MAKNLQDYVTSILQKINQAMFSWTEVSTSCKDAGIDTSVYESSLNKILEDLRYCKTNTTYSGLSDSSTGDSIKSKLESASSYSASLIKSLVALGNIEKKVPYSAQRALKYTNTTTIRNSYFSSPAKEMNQNINSALSEVNSYKRASFFSGVADKFFHEDIDLDSELEHYGRLGMKWGMHIFGDEKEAHKAIKKVKKLDKKSTLKKERSELHKAKGDRKRVKADLATSSRKHYKNLKKANRQYRRSHRTLKTSVRASRKARKIVSIMNDEFANTKISSFSPEELAIGERYSIDLIRRYQNERMR